MLSCQLRPVGALTSGAGGFGHSNGALGAVAQAVKSSVKAAVSAVKGLRMGAPQFVFSLAEAVFLSGRGALGCHYGLVPLGPHLVLAGVVPVRPCADRGQHGEEDADGPGLDHG